VDREGNVEGQSHLDQLNHTGASTFGDVQYSPLTGHYHQVQQGTELEDGLNVAADGVDVGGTHGRTHHTIYPDVKMKFDGFSQKFLDSGWSYAGKR
jgi:hypothetical protein